LFYIQPQTSYLCEFSYIWALYFWLTSAFPLNLILDLQNLCGKLVGWQCNIRSVKSTYIFVRERCDFSEPYNLCFKARIHTQTYFNYEITQIFTHSVSKSPLNFVTYVTLRMLHDLYSLLSADIWLVFCYNSMRALFVKFLKAKHYYTLQELNNILLLQMFHFRRVS